MQLGGGVQLIDVLGGLLRAAGADDVHPERLGQPGDVLSDAAQPDDGEGLAGDASAGERLAVQLTGRSLAEGARQLFAEGHADGDGPLGDGQGAAGASAAGDGDGAAPEIAVVEVGDAGGDLVDEAEVGGAACELEGRREGDQDGLGVCEQLVAMLAQLGRIGHVPEAARQVRLGGLARPVSDELWPERLPSVNDLDAGIDSLDLSDLLRGERRDQHDLHAHILTARLRTW